MLTLPDEYHTLFIHYRPFFSKRGWPLAVILLGGAILAPGKRTVTAALRIMGVSQERYFQNYQRVLNRAVGSSLAVRAVLLRTFLPFGPIVLGLDEIIARQCGEHIQAKGISRDPVRSSKSHFVKASGLGWISLMLLVHIP
jgi:hypothetical protein